MPISTFPRHDYDEDEYLLKPAGLRDTHSEGKVIVTERGGSSPPPGTTENPFKQAGELAPASDIKTLSAIDAADFRPHMANE